MAVTAAGSPGPPAQRASGGKAGLVSQKAKAALQTPSTKSGSLQKAGASPPPLRKTQLHKGSRAGQPLASAATNPHDEAVREAASAPLLPGQVVHMEADSEAPPRHGATAAASVAATPDEAAAAVASLEQELQPAAEALPSSLLAPLSGQKHLLQPLPAGSAASRPSITEKVRAELPSARTSTAGQAAGLPDLPAMGTQDSVLRDEPQLSPVAQQDSGLQDMDAGSIADEAGHTEKGSCTGAQKGTSGRSSQHVSPQPDDSLTRPCSSAPASLRIRVVTFNMNFKQAGTVPEALLGRSGCPPGMAKYDLVIVGTQESGPAKDLLALLSKALGHKYVQLASETLMAISINIFVRRKLRDHFSDVRTSSVATGIGNVLGNKGAVAVAATYLQKVSLLFINSHFAAHQDKVLQRQADFMRIRSGLFLAKDAQEEEAWPSFSTQDQTLDGSPKAFPDGLLRQASTASSVTSAGSITGSSARLSLRMQQWAMGSTRDVTEEHDVSIWLGDLNYRVEGNRRVVDLAIAEGMFEVLKANDQLRKEQMKGNVFQNFEEGSIYFAPTFKFDNGTDTYDTSAKSRTPSWCDRILWKCHAGSHPVSAQLLQYSAVPEVRTSDHKPVVASLILQTNLNAMPAQSRRIARIWKQLMHCTIS